MLLWGKRGVMMGFASSIVFQGWIYCNREQFLNKTYTLLLKKSRVGVPGSFSINFIH